MSHGGENYFFSGWPVMMPSLPATSGGELSTLSKMMQACKHNIGNFSLFHVPVNAFMDPCSYPSKHN